jgi:hypothetical protein
MEHKGTEYRLSDNTFQVVCKCGDRGEPRPTDQRAWGEYIMHLAMLFPRVDIGAF